MKRKIDYESKLKAALKDSPKLVHASNLLHKVEKNDKKKEYKQALKEIIPKYLSYLHFCRKNKFPSQIKQIVERLNFYYDFVDHNSPYSPQAKVQSSILEEFLYLLFEEKVRKINEKNSSIYSGSANAYSNLYFIPDPQKDNDEYEIGVQKKQQDYAIYRKFGLDQVFSKQAALKIKDSGLNVPIVAIECKTYIDKTMLDAAIALAEKLKSGNPQSLFLVVAEEYDISEQVDPSYSRIDQIYILRKNKKKQKNDKNYKKKKIQADVVSELYRRVCRHLERDRKSIIDKIEQKGVVI